MRKIFRWLRNIFSQLTEINLVKTLWFNFHYFPLRDAVIMPVFVYKGVKLLRDKGFVDILGGVYTGQIRLGAVYIQNSDRKRKLVWKVEGRVVLHGIVCIGFGTVIDVKRNATLVLGSNFKAVGNSTIICHTGITFGDGCLMSWDCLLMDRDYHSIYDKSNRLINEPKPIRIGNSVWIGCRSTILKGCTISDHSVIAACSLITKSCHEKNVVISGTGNVQTILKEGIYWDIREEINQ